MPSAFDKLHSQRAYVNFARLFGQSSQRSKTDVLDARFMDHEITRRKMSTLYF
jgi:hypothetical protein